jgi:hypothetical protein
MARQQITIATDIAVSSCDSSAIESGGPHYAVNYGASIAAVQVGDWVYIEHRQAGDSGGDILSNYTYQVTGITDSDTLVIKYITDEVVGLEESSMGDASPCDLNSGEGSSGSPENSPHTFKRDLGSAFEMFVE